MPKIADFQILIGQAAAELQQDLVAMQLTVNTLPELPGNAEYLQLQGFNDKRLARLMLNIGASSRAEAVDVLKNLEPMPLSHSHTALIAYCPEAVSKPVAFGHTYTGIFPAWLHSKMQPEEPCQTTALVWYHQPDNIGIPDLRLFVVAHLINDPARIFPVGTLGLPENGVICAEDENPNRTTRSVSIHWPRGIDMAEWYEGFTNVPEDEWASIIEAPKL